jgi:hypothetical protein
MTYTVGAGSRFLSRKRHSAFVALPVGQQVAQRAAVGRDGGEVVVAGFLRRQARERQVQVVGALERQALDGLALRRASLTVCSGSRAPCRSVLTTPK